MVDLKSYYKEVFAAQDVDPQKSARTRDAEDTIPHEAREKMFDISAEIKSKFHEFGSPMPPLLKGCSVLDLGCGSGRDTYLAAQLVGPKGTVVGVEPNAKRLDIAKKYLDREMKQFGFDKPNVVFMQEYWEDLSSIESSSIDVVISNCMLNMSPHKQKVMSEVYRVLKEGGEFYFTDVFSDRRIPAALAEDPQWIAARLGGALYIEDFRRLAQDAGFLDPRYLMRFKTPLTDEEQLCFGDVSFATITSRLIKSSLLEDICESYGEKITYLGTLPDYPDYFLFDSEIKFPTGKELEVCGNVTGTVGTNRYKEVFKVVLDRSHHIGDTHGDHIIKTSPDYTGVIDEDDQPIKASCC